MLKNVSIATDILAGMGFVSIDSKAKQTLMKRGDKIAEVLPNGSVKIGKEVTEFKKVKRLKISGI
jgi:hypothetical protein